VDHSIKMSVRDWIAVEDNPIQRDTERHAAKATHLMTPLQTHAFVSAAQLPNGKLIKLDGHTRAFMWKRGDVLPPRQLLTVNIIAVKDKAEAEALYKTFDNSAALESLRDKVSGGFNRFGLDAQSPLLKAGSIGSGLKIAYAVLSGCSFTGGGHADGRPDIYALIKEFQNEIIALDAFGPLVTLKACTTAVTAAFVLTVRRHGRVAIPFWAAYFNQQGVKAGGKMDGVQAVSEMMLERRKGKYGGSATAEQCARIVRGFEGWINDEKFQAMPRPMDLTGYLASQRRSAERLIKKADIERELNA
jgi:hypothetical protein